MEEKADMDIRINFNLAIVDMHIVLNNRNMFLGLLKDAF